MTYMNNHNKNGMHSDDKRNMVIFFVAMVGVLFLYNMFIYQPKMQAIREAQEKAAREIPSNISMPQAPTVLNRADVVASGGRVKIESDTLTGSLDLTGARIDDLSLKNYMTEPNGTDPVALLNPKNVAHAYYGEFGWLSNDSSVAVPNGNTRWQSNAKTLSVDSPVTLSWNNGHGLLFRKLISLDKNYMFSIRESVVNLSGKAVTLFPYAKISRNGLPEHMTGAYILHEGPIGYIGDELYEVNYKDLDKEENETARAKEGWIGFTDKYWLAALTTGKDYKDEVKFRFVGEPSANGVTHYQTDMMGAALTVQSGAEQTVPIEFFAGPKIVSMLEDYAGQYDIPHFDLAVDFGIFYFLTRPFYEALTFLNGIFGNFAISLLVFTVIIKTITFYLFGRRSYRSFARMRKVSPQMVELREKYGSDRVKLQQALFDLYKRENVNPVAGCVPLLFQIPIFFALYKVFYVNIAMRHQPFWGWIDDMSAMDPTNLFQGFGLFPWDTPLWLHIGLWPIIMGCTMALQQRLSPPPQDQTQRIVMSIMPIWITFILAKFPAGLVIYWSWSNIISVIQQYLMLREEGVSVNIFTRSRSEKELEEMVAEGPSVHPEMEILDHDDIEPETKTVKPKTRKRKK